MAYCPPCSTEYFSFPFMVVAIGGVYAGAFALAISLILNVVLVRKVYQEHKVGKVAKSRLVLTQKFMEKKKELKYNSPHKPSLDERHSDTKVKLRKPISYDAHDMHMKTSQSSESLNSLNGGVRHRPGRQKSHLVASDSLRNLIDGDSPKRRSHADSAGTATESKGPTTLAVPHSLSLT